MKTCHVFAGVVLLVLLLERSVGAASVNTESTRAGRLRIIRSNSQAGKRQLRQLVMPDLATTSNARLPSAGSRPSNMDGVTGPQLMKRSGRGQMALLRSEVATSTSERTSLLPAPRSFQQMNPRAQCDDRRLMQASDTAAELQQPAPPTQILNDSVTLLQLLPLNWALDRLNQRSLPLDGVYSYDSNMAGEGVDVYVLDGGLKESHDEFTTVPANGRSKGGSDSSNRPGGKDSDDGGAIGRSRALPGRNFIPDQDPDNATDSCRGHGTAVASMVAGRTLGVARDAFIIPVRFINCSGHFWASDLVLAIEWSIQHAASRPTRRAVINLSSLVNGSVAVIDNAVAAAVKAGITVVRASGNEAQDACGFSPSLKEDQDQRNGMIVAGASKLAFRNSSTLVPIQDDTLVNQGNAANGRSEIDDNNTIVDEAVEYSNRGPCVDVMAPGEELKTAAIECDACLARWNGTSFAAPLVAGIAAGLLSANAFPHLSPQCVRSTILAMSTSGVVDLGAAQIRNRAATPNRLAYQPSSVAEAAAFIPPTCFGSQYGNASTPHHISTRRYAGQR